MNNYLINYNNKILGIYNNLDLSLEYIYSLINSGLIDKKLNVTILEYKINSCILLNEFTVDLNYNIINKSFINYTKNNSVFIKNKVQYESDSSITTSCKSSESNESSLTNSIKSSSSTNTSEEERRKKAEREFIEKQNKLAQDKIDINHQINILKEEQKKNDEKLEQFNYDLELYNKFKNIKNKDNSFNIPFMFENKYDCFQKLDKLNKISLENFTKLYKPEKIETSFNDLFDEPYYISENESISEIFSNANDDDLYAATNQIILRESESNDTVNTTTTSYLDSQSNSSSKNSE
jgi:hypothetical protein